MCGRFALYSDTERIAKYFSASLTYQFGKSYNVAPTTMIPVLVSMAAERAIVPMRWGLIPSWHKEGQKLGMMVNAKVETIDLKPSFRAPFKRHRCLVIADGFYEWDAGKTPKQPYYFSMKDNNPMALAAIWDRWISPNGSVESCCLITEPANEVVSSVHHRMPVIMTPDHYDQWLGMDFQDTAILKKMAMDVSGYAEVIKHPVSTKVNRAAFDNPSCIDLYHANL